MKQIILTLVAVAAMGMAQEPVANPVPNTGWRKLNPSEAGPPPRSGAPVHVADAMPAPLPSESLPAPLPEFQEPPPNRDAARAYEDQGPPPPPRAPQLTIRPGTYITVRVDQPLSSDYNQEGDAFSATLVRPVVVDGVVVAQRGQAINGRVAEAQKAGRSKGVSRLALQLTDMTLVDGQQMPIQAQLISRSGDTSVGRDAAAIGGTTALGAAIGAAADGGVGAAIGAGAGAAAGAIGVLLTRGRPTEIYPEMVLTFRMEAPVMISTERAPNAFRYVDPQDYERAPVQTQLQRRPAPRPLVRPYAYGGYWGGYDPFYYGYGYGFGPTLGFGFYSGPRGFFGRGFYGGGRGYYGGRGFYRRR